MTKTNKTKENFHIHQQRIKIWFHKHVAGDKQFQVGDLVLKWDKARKAKGKHSKFQKLWLGPYRLPRKSVMQPTDCNLYRETWKTSMSMHPS